MRNLTSDEQLLLSRRAARLEHRWPAAPDSAFIQSRFDAMMHQYRAVGAALTLLYPNGTERTFVYGLESRRTKQPVRRGTFMRIASVTKTVTALGLLALCEDGLLSLDSDLSGVLGFQFRNPLDPSVPITARMLLTHTSGIFDPPVYAQQSPSHFLPLQSLLSEQGVWQQRPGETFHYTNLGAGILGMVIARASGSSLQEYMQRRIFSPLGIKAGYGARYLQEPVADGYHVRLFLPPRLSYDAEVQKQTAAPDSKADYLSAVGSLCTDSHGLAALLRLISSSVDTPVLSSRALLEMRRCQDASPHINHAGRGLGLSFLSSVYPDFSPVGHQGVAYGMCCEAFIDPRSNCGAAFFTNGAVLGHLPLKAVGFDALTLAFHAFSR